jgi:hypothetical protein
LDSVGIAVLIVGVIVLIAVAALWMKRHRANKDKIPLFNCTITTDGKESGNPNSPDVYDCVEVKDDSIKPDEKT